MCSYPCFGLSKTGFTPPSQLLKLINFFFKTETKSLPMQKSAAKTASLPIMKSAAKTASSFHIYIYIYFLLGVYKMCADYRKLNLATRKDHFPLPFMDQMLERLAG